MRQLYERICRFFFWGWKLKDSYDWDFGYLNKMIHLKLVRMEAEFKQNGCTEWSHDLNNNPPKQRLGRVFKTCVFLSERVTDDKYYDFYEEKINEKWGKRVHTKGGPFFGKRSKVITEKDKKLERKERIRYYTLAEKQKKFELNELHRLLGKYGEGFWD